MKGKVLISRNYRGDIDNSVIDKFIGKYRYRIRSIIFYGTVQSRGTGIAAQINAGLFRQKGMTSFV
jgi:hypothetical protein